MDEHLRKQREMNRKNKEDSKRKKKEFHEVSLTFKKKEARAMRDLSILSDQIKHHMNLDFVDQNRKMAQRIQN